MSETTTDHDQAYGRQIPDPDPLLMPVSAREAAAQIAAESGRSPRVAEAMLRAYLDDVSAEIGVPVHQWGLDAADVTEARRRFEWVDFEQGETITDARARAAREAAGWTAAAARVDREHAPGHAARIDQEVRYWTERARDPHREDPDQDEGNDEDAEHDDKPVGWPPPGPDPLDAARQACTVLPAQISVAAALDEAPVAAAGLHHQYDAAETAGEAAAR